MISAIEFTCPYCETEYVLWDEAKGAISPHKYKKLTDLVAQQHKIGRCKACKRKYTNVPTTFEMDGLLTREDILNRNKVMKQCRDCKKWTQMKKDSHVACSSCGSDNYDPTSMKSYRTFNPLTDNKRKPKVKK